MKILKVSAHCVRCEICREMYSRGYQHEEDYWGDFFADTLKPVKYKLVKMTKKKKVL